MIYLEEKEDEKWLVFLPRQKSINILCSYTIIKVCTQILLCTHIGLELWYTYRGLLANTRLYIITCKTIRAMSEESCLLNCELCLALWRLDYTREACVLNHVSFEQYLRVFSSRYLSIKKLEVKYKI